MKITPLDIENHAFGKKMRGFDPQEVQSFLHLVSEEYEKLFAENLKLQEDLGAMEKLLEEHRGRETTLRETRAPSAIVVPAPMASGPSR